MAETPEAEAVKSDPQLSAAVESVKALVADRILAYSAWAESEGLFKKPKKKDARTHEDLVNEFLEK